MQADRHETQKRPFEGREKRNSRNINMDIRTYKYVHTHTYRNEAQAASSGKRKFKKDEYIFVVFDGGTTSIAVVKLKKDALVRTHMYLCTYSCMYACMYVCAWSN